MPMNRRNREAFTRDHRRSAGYAQLQGKEPPTGPLPFGSSNDAHEQRPSSDVFTEVLASDASRETGRHLAGPFKNGATDKRGQRPGSLYRIRHSYTRAKRRWLKATGHKKAGTGLYIPTFVQR